MYLKLKSNGSTSSYAEYYGLVAIQQAVISNSVYTSTPINSALSAAVGTAPSSSVYANYGSWSSPQYNASSDGWWGFTKRHYAYDSGSNYTPTSGMYFHHDDSWGFRVKTTTNNMSNMGPGGASSYWTGYSNSSYDYAKSGGDHWDWIDEVHIIVNDTTFAMQIISTGTDSSRSVSTVILNDIEYNASIDTHSYAGNALYCPTVGINMFIQGNPYLDSQPPTSNQHRFTVYRPQYVDRGGTYRNSSYSDAGLQWGYVTTSYGAYAKLYPEARSRVGSMQVANGETTNQLVPVYYDPGMRDEVNDTRYGRLMNLYRTTEGSSLRTGDVITDGTTRYRIFANCYKAGGANMADNGVSATYAFPEDNVPYSAP